MTFLAREKYRDHVLSLSIRPYRPSVAGLFVENNRKVLGGAKGVTQLNPHGIGR